MLNCYLQRCNMTVDRRIMSSEHMLLDHWQMKLMMNVSFVQVIFKTLNFKSDIFVETLVLAR